MNYQQLGTKLTMILKNDVYQSIYVSYLKTAEQKDLFTVIWQNAGGNSGHLAEIRDATVTLYGLDNLKAIQIIMEFAKQSHQAKLDLPKATKINRETLITIEHLVQFFEQADRYQKVHLQIRDQDLADVKSFLDDNEALFEKEE